MRELVSSDEQYKFGVNKHDTLPKFCLECPVLFACNGECPKNQLHFNSRWGTWFELSLLQDIKHSSNTQMNR